MARGGKRGGMILSKVTPPEEHAYGSNAEMEGRDQVAKQMPPTAFTQIGPEDNGGLNLASPTQGNRSGKFKFSGGV